jgi:hypothetical protein
LTSKNGQIIPVEGPIVDAPEEEKDIPESAELSLCTTCSTTFAADMAAASAMAQTFTITYSFESVLIPV